MRDMTRRLFIKSAVAIAAIGSLGKYFFGKYTEPMKGGIMESIAKGGMGIPVVSDVDAHSQCRMRVNIEEGRVTEVRGDPTDPEGKGSLTLRGEHIKELLYALDRLTCPRKRVGERGDGKWERISWDEALTTIAERLKGIKQTYGGRGTGEAQTRQKCWGAGRYVAIFSPLLCHLGSFNVGTGVL